MVTRLRLGLLLIAAGIGLAALEPLVETWTFRHVAAPAFTQGPGPMPDMPRWISAPFTLRPEDGAVGFAVSTTARATDGGTRPSYLASYDLRLLADHASVAGGAFTVLLDDRAGPIGARSVNERRLVLRHTVLIPTELRAEVVTNGGGTGVEITRLHLDVLAGRSALAEIPRLLGAALAIAGLVLAGLALVRRGRA